MNADYLVVGAGFAGSTVAERLARAGKHVMLIEKRAHIGGNAYDELDTHGLLVHKYGPHIFHTNARRVMAYLSKFTQWRFYEHRVLSVVDGELYPVPINLDTINRLYGLQLDSRSVGEFLESVREPRSPLRTSEDVLLNSIGRDLYQKFFLNYTRKQWGLDPAQLSAAVAARVPVRTDTDNRYFLDDYQFMPAQGYTPMFERMLDHPRIQLHLGTDFAAVRERIGSTRIVFTGPIDAYFGYRLGRLPYRSLRFEHLHMRDTVRFQPTGTVNYPNDHTFTRITEFKHLTGQKHSGSSIVREYPCAEGDPYYPIPRPENEQLYKRYCALAAAEPHVTFVGRLAQYRYYNMDQVVAAALTAARHLLGTSTLELERIAV
jgi:UDP-galactopyranose mutase